MSEITQAVGAPLERQVRPERVDWHGHGLSWAAADAFEGGSDWTADDVARAFAAGAKAALTQAASVHARNATSTADVLDLRAALLALVDAADEVGVRHFDSDFLSDDVQAMQAATMAARNTLAEHAARVLGPNVELTGDDRTRAASGSAPG